MGMRRTKKENLRWFMKPLRGFAGKYWSNVTSSDFKEECDTSKRVKEVDYRVKKT